jgi:Kdo2-lipid IVA lauroyltransferase/acyltransferase
VPESTLVRPSWRHRLESWAVTATSAFVNALPAGAAGRAGRALGLAFYALDRPHRRLTLANLAAAFPERPPREIGRTGREVFEHFGRLLVELLRFSRLSPSEMVAAGEIVGADRAERARQRGRGVLFVTGHFGFWEMQALVHGAVFWPVTVVARPLDNPLLHDLLERVRTSTGNRVIYRRGALRRIMRALQANEGVAVLIDQHIQPADALVVDFFGRPVATTSAVATLAWRTGVPVVPVFALPLGPGRFRLVYEPPVDPPRDGSPEALREFTQRCTDVLEMYVRRHPSLWLWMHRRWRDDVGPAPARGMFPPGKVEESDSNGSGL